jgi:subtilisin family serine protease
VSQTLDQTNSRSLDTLNDLRRREISKLIHDNRRVIETDPNGDPIVRSEILALAMSEEAQAQARSRGFVIDRQVASAALLVLKVPANMATKKALRELRESDPRGVYDYNHLYIGVGASTGDEAASQTTVPQPVAGAAMTRLRVGLLDTGVDAAHPAFRDSVMHVWGCGANQVPSAHGTAVASLLVAHASADLYTADVYCGLPTGGSVDAIVAALGWMTEQHVAVINVSLVGPKNALLERSVRSLIERGHLIVAAVGNDGPAAAPLYPAAYADVVGVTAVDSHRHALIEAERGPQVMFAAQGADLEAAGMDHGYVAVRGTSYAAPTVAAMLAAMLSAPDRQAALTAIDVLAKQAVHLGSAGKDLTYGFGLVGAEFP